MAADDDLPDEAPEADALDQRRGVSDDGTHDVDISVDDSLEVPEADALDQAREVSDDDEPIPGD